MASNIKLTKAQAAILHQLQRGAELANSDECTPQWWIERGAKVNWNTATSLVYHKLVSLSRHEGGQPGVLFYTITSAGLEALREVEGR